MFYLNLHFLEADYFLLGALLKIPIMHNKI